MILPVCLCLELTAVFVVAATSSLDGKAPHTKQNWHWPIYLSSPTAGCETGLARWLEGRPTINRHARACRYVLGRVTLLVGIIVRLVCCLPGTSST